MKGAFWATASLAAIGLTASQIALRSSAAADARAAGAEIDIVGRYEYASFNVGLNKHYKGPVEVTRMGEYYQVRYDNGSGAGVGIRRGDLLSISYTYRDGSSGGELLVIEKGPEGPILSGQYTLNPGSGKLGRDRWTFTKTAK